MRSNSFSLLLRLTASLYLLTLHAQPAPSTASRANGRTALLIGISTYDHSPADIKTPPDAPPEGRFQPAMTYHDLKGPKFDVQAIKDLLSSQKFGFVNDDQHIHVLFDKDATRARILAAMQQDLVEKPKPGDTVVLYISSHGSVRRDPKGHGNLYTMGAGGRDATYLENTIVPYDWYLGADDIFGRDLRHVFNQAAAKGVHVTAIFDSCHSGSLSRGVIRPGIVSRDFDFDPRPMPPDPYPQESAGAMPQDRTDAPTLILSAAQKDQAAVDVQEHDPPYGLFTHALIETLKALPANRPADDIFRRLEVSMELIPDASHQQPELDTSDARRKQPIFGGEAQTGPATAVVVSVDSSGALLDIGSASDVGPGTEFEPIADGVKAVLRVTDGVGLTRSRADVSPKDAVKAGDVVQLKKWVPAQRPALLMFAGAATLPMAQIQKESGTAQATGLKLIADPSKESWTHHVIWDGAKWVAEPNSKSVAPGRPEKPIVLGGTTSASAWKKLGSSAVVWFDPPLPQEAAGGFFPKPADGERPSAATLTNDRAQAGYVLAGAVTDSGLQYAWFKRSDLDGAVQTPADIGPGCSPHSPYPLRTDWIPATDLNLVGQKLTESAVQLARLNGWLQLEASSLTGQTGFPYQLGLRRIGDQRDLPDGGSTYPGGYELALVETSHASTAPRWVYVLAIDCQGKGSLVWPLGKPPGEYPTENGRLSRIPLPGIDLKVSPPYGTDTYLLLTTTTQISRPEDMKFDGVASRGAEAAKIDPLEDLLDSTSLGTRSPARPMPSNWSVGILRVESRATPTPAGNRQ